ncbi:MAG: MBL fold metallo-hydrolase [Verrucomicrobiota bacterium]|jgi:glyoxylase-like metal-dependent hydrolase (beta-lactamase superfamily II)|nr:MBL fold metallo-hydrolase [Verrucomicrobiota bacterium]
MKTSIVLCLASLLTAPAARAASNTFTYAVGDVKVTLLSERQQTGDKKILIGATEEMLKQTAPDGTFPNAVNAFLVRTKDQTILVDAGFGIKLFDNLKEVGLAPGDIDAVLLTHMHGDHIGGLLRDGKPAFPKADLYIATPERDYWVGATPPDSPQRQALAAYADRLHLFNARPPEDANVRFPLLDNILPIAAYGHTPGHTVYEVSSGGKRLLIWGDLTHAMAVQMPYPQVAVTYDIDPAQAVASRKAILDYVAQKPIPVAGMHIAFPGIGTVTKHPNGDGYTFEPVTP